MAEIRVVFNGRAGDSSITPDELMGLLRRAGHDAVLHDPAHPYARALAAAIPHPGLRGQTRPVLQGDPPNPADRPSGCAFHPRCPIAEAICRTSVPALLPRQDGRQVACHAAHRSDAGVHRERAA